MGSKRRIIGLALAGAAVALAAPVLSQDSRDNRDGPESLLPPGFGDPVPPAPEPVPNPRVTPSEPGPVVDVPLALPADSAATAGVNDTLTPEQEAAEEDARRAYDLPAQARRSTAAIGVIGPDKGGFGATAFAGADGRFLVTLADRLNAPLPSRWNAIVLRRALLSEAETPRGVDPADWTAARAWLLLRMGEADGARLLVQSVDTDHFTPRLYSVAMQTSLAIGDPAGLCRIAEPGERYSNKPAWPMARAMCAALSGEPGPASAILETMRRQGRARGIDLTLAEKVVGAGLNSRRSTTVEWTGVGRMTTWRYGLASATAVDIPQNLIATMPLHARAWQARSAMLPVAERAAPGDIAASLGVLSSAALVDLYGAIADSTDSSEIAGSLPDLLRLAYADDDVDGRMSALRSIWTSSDDPRTRFARKILTARAAAAIPVNPAFETDVADLVGAMLTAGLDIQAARWARQVDAMKGDAADSAWAMLAVGTPRPAVRVDGARFNAFRDRVEDPRRAKLLFAGLAALDRLPQAEKARLSGELGVPLTPTSRWAQLIDRAATEGQGGTVALLAAVGMQTGSWAQVPAEHLFHIVSALRRVGREPEARMIAAEAMMRT